MPKPRPAFSVLGIGRGGFRKAVLALHGRTLTIYQDLLSLFGQEYGKGHRLFPVIPLGEGRGAHSPTAVHAVYYQMLFIIFS